MNMGHFLYGDIKTVIARTGNTHNPDVRHIFLNIFLVVPVNANHDDVFSHYEKLFNAKKKTGFFNHKRHNVSDVKFPCPDTTFNAEHIGKLPLNLHF